MISLEDKYAIQELISRFAHYSDYGAWDALPALYTDDVVTEMDGQPVQYRGIAEQVSHARDSEAQTGGKNRHYYFNFVIDEIDGEVVALYMFANVNAGTNPMEGRFVVTGRGRDTVVKGAEGWKIARRRITFDQYLLITS